MGRVAQYYLDSKEVAHQTLRERLHLRLWDISGLTSTEVETTQTTAWYPKGTPTFSDCLYGVRHPIGAQMVCKLVLGPKHVCEWHLRRLLCASYGCWRTVLGGLVEAVIEVLPPAEDGRVLLVVDGTYKAKTAHKHPLVKKGRFNRYSRYVRGLEVVVLMLLMGSVPYSH